MIIIGVTGTSGAGKSTVSTIIKNNTGALVIDADRIAKELMIKKPEKNNGKIDRKKLAVFLFENDENREILNKLTFKYVGAKTKEIIMENQDKEIIVLDFPLLYEGGFNKICNYVIGVIADKETKIARIKERDRISKEQVEARINVQIKEEQLKEKADYIVNNSNNIRYIALVNDVIRLIHKIKKDEEEKNKS